ncbi:MAG: CvpA family protein [Alphaproteobacteria bacterium]|nr:CvpA family protein [Alphaproteobacteria bacterium]
MVVDLIVVAVLLISALISFLRGFIREILTIAGVAGGLAAAYFGGPLLIPTMRGWFGVQEDEEPGKLFDVLPYDIVADVLSYGLIFIVVVVILSILSHFLAEGAKHIGLGAVDRTLGFVFGLLRGVLLLGLLYLPVHFFIDKDSKESWFSGSQTHFYIERVSEKMAAMVPSSAVEGMEKSIEEGSQTRQQLENINLLKKDSQGKDARTEGSEGEAKQGYTEEFRDKMDDLFKEKTQPSGEQNP